MTAHMLAAGIRTGLLFPTVGGRPWRRHDWSNWPWSPRAFGHSVAVCERHYLRIFKSFDFDKRTRADDAIRAARRTISGEQTMFEIRSERVICGLARAPLVPRAV